MLTDILQPTHLIILLIVALIVLGPKRLPDAGRALGQGLKEFKTSISAGHDDSSGDSCKWLSGSAISANGSRGRPAGS